jgi:hypothetical protein
MESLERIKHATAGQFLYTYHDTGAMGVSPMIFQVIRVNRVTITIRTEQDTIIRRPFNFFVGFWTEPGKYGCLKVT